MDDTVLLSTLLNSVLQKAYGDLTNLTELLPRKTDVDRKLEIVQYARNTRQLLIRILGLVKWTKVSTPVQQCAEVSTQINHHAWVFIDTADQLAHLSRNVLQQAGMPNFSLAPAIDVLTLGAYPRLPTCIRDRIIPPPPLTSTEKQDTWRLLESIMRYRLSHEFLPPTMKVADISKGHVTLRVPYEFEAVLTVVGNDPTLPWRLLELKILVGEALSGSPVLVTQQQLYFLHQMVQSHLCGEESSLKDMYYILHNFCLSLQLDRLHAQVERLSVAVCGIYIKIEEYSPGKHLKVGYWRNLGSTDYMGPPQSPFVQKEVTPSPKLFISINPHVCDKPFTTTHTPPLPSSGDATLSVHPHHLSFQELLVQCVRVRSLALLKEYLEVLSHTPWHQHASLIQTPPCLRVTLKTPLSSDTLLLSVDGRVGQVVASLESISNPSEQVLKVLQVLEQRIVINRTALPDLVGYLLSELYLTHITSLAGDYRLSVKRSLPMNTPLPLEPLLLFICLEPSTYLVANVSWLNNALSEKFFILRVVPCSVMPAPTEGDTAIPKYFMKAVSLVEIGLEKVLSHLIGSLPVKRSSVKLKRKIQTNAHLLPSVKRLCVCPSSVLPSLPGLLSVTERLSHLRSSLTSANISAISVSSGGLGAPHIEIYNVPTTVCNDKEESLLSSLVCSYELWPHPDHVHSKLVFCDVLDPRSHVPVTIHTISSYKDIGNKILRDWTDKTVLLALTLELHSFLKRDTSQLSKRCFIKNYTYGQLTLSYDEFTMNINAIGEGVVIDCPAPSPHQYLSSTLQQFLQQTQSLPLLLKGICSTYSCLKDLTIAFDSFASTKLIGVAPSHIRLKKDLISLDVLLLCNEGVAFRGITWEKDSLPAIVTQPSILIILKSFLSIQLQGQLPDNLKDESSSVMPLGVSKPSQAPSSLGPLPVPITSLPSIPSLPPPTNSQPLVGVVSTGSPEWEYILTREEWQKLLTIDPVKRMSVLEMFIGSLYLLVYWIKEASNDKYLHSQMTYVSVDHGVFTYNVDVLSVSVGLDTTSMTSMMLSIKPLQEGVWTEKDLQTLTDFFHKHVITPPYTPQALVAFLQLFWIPRRAMKSCIQIMQLQMQPSTDTQWRVNICLCVPNGIDLGEIARPGSAGIIYRGKLLLFLNLTRQKDQMVLNLPILHDPKTNFNYVARRTGSAKQDHSPALQVIDQTLRKPSQEWNIPPNESSLAYCIQHLLNVNLPV